MTEEQQKILDLYVYTLDRRDKHFGRTIYEKDCRYQVHDEFGVGLRQCYRNWVEKIGGFGFCKQHAKKIKERLGI